MVGLLFSNIRCFFRKRSFATVFIVLQSLLCFALLYTMYEFKILSNQDTEINYSVSISGSAEIEKALNGPLKKKDNLFSDVKIVASSNIEETLPNSPRFVCVVKGKRQPQYGEMPDNNSQEKQIVLGSSVLTSTVNIGDNVQLSGVDYSVVGLIIMGNTCYINTISLKGFSDMEVSYTANGKITKNNAHNYLENLEKKWQGSVVTISTPEAVDFEEASISTLIVVLLIVFCALFFVGTFFLYYYELTTRKRQIQILKLCGTNQTNVTITYLIEFLIYGMIQFVLGLIMYWLFYALFAPIKDVNLTVNEYFTVYGIVFAISVGTIFPVINKNIKQYSSEVGKSA